MKKGVLFLICIIFLIGLITAQGEKIEVSTLKDVYSIGEQVGIKISLVDSNNNLINAQILIVLENAKKTRTISKMIETNKVEYIDLKGKGEAGYWSASTKYNSIEAKALFSIESSEIVKFDIIGETLIITNVGNTPYRKDVQILIGDTIGVQSVDLAIGENLSLRLLAPNGNYNVKITDGKTTFSRYDVPLTGEVIGFFDEKIKSTAGITGVRTNGSTSLFSKDNLFIYVFIGIIIATAFLILIERHYSKKFKN